MTKYVVKDRYTYEKIMDIDPESQESNGLFEEE